MVDSTVSRKGDIWTVRRLGEVTYESSDLDEDVTF